MNETISKCKQIIEDNLNHKISLDDIAYELGYSKYHLLKLFKKETGLTMNQYLTNRRLISASKKILEGEKIIDVAMSFGYETQSGFNKAFSKKFGFPPNMIHAMRMIKRLFSEEGDDYLHENTLYKKLIMNMDGNQVQTITTAYELVKTSLGDKKRYSGESYIVHPLHVAMILKEMDVDFDTILLGLLHESTLVDSLIEPSIIIKAFGKEILEKIQAINDLTINKHTLNTIENYSTDVLMVKLADRLHNMKTLQHLSPTRWEVKAKETLDLFIPLADKLELEILRLELEHLSINYSK